jgi:hypothetical protein
MAKYNNGILGPFKGQVGTVEGSSWKEMEIMKSKRSRRTGPPTQKQTEQQARFRFMNQFVSTLIKLFESSFNEPLVKMTAVNCAFHYNYKKALRGTYPLFSFNYRKMLVSKGTLLNANDPMAAAIGGGLVKFTWTDNSDMAQAEERDRSMLVVHCPVLNQSVYITEGAVRSRGHAVIDAGIFTGQQVETWLSFTSEDGREVANSMYTGSLLIA